MPPRRVARERGSGDHPTAPGTGAPDGHRRVECHSSSSGRQTDSLEAAVSAGQRPDRTTDPPTDHHRLSPSQLDTAWRPGCARESARCLLVPPRLTAGETRRHERQPQDTGAKVTNGIRQQHRPRLDRPTVQRIQSTPDRNSCLSRNLVIAHSNVRSLTPNMNAVIRTMNAHKIDITVFLKLGCISMF